MAASGIKGVYADRPIDPHSKRAARKAEAAAVHSLPEAYRLLIEIVDDHNNRPHTTLKRRRELSLNNVPPTPKEAYLWGLKNITGLRRAPLTDDDYKKLLLSTDKASISNGVLRYKQRPYLPENEAAYDIAKKSTTRAQSIDIRLDKTDPHEIYVVTTRREWALFRITEGAAKELAKITLDEEDLLSSQTSKLWAKAEHKSRVARVAAKSTRKSVKQKGTATKVDRQQLLVARQKETAAIKRKVIGNDDPKKSKIEVVSRTSNWTDIEEKERLSNLELIRKHRSKK
jgi:hypothetical protein